MKHAQREYELVPYESTNYLFSVGKLTYVLPHIHREMELALVLTGEIDLFAAGETVRLFPGDFWYMNPCQCHELSSAVAGKSSLFAELQVSGSFFRQYYPAIDRLRILPAAIREDAVPATALSAFRQEFLSAAEAYFSGAPFYELTCAASVNRLFAALAGMVPHAMLSREDFERNGRRTERMQRLSGYIEEHLSEKLLLSDLAAQEGLTLTSLSHFFTENFGMPFQTYLSHARCRRAESMLVTTKESIAGISLACGFSAPKYMNAAFLRLAGMKPAEYRAKFAGREKTEGTGSRTAAPAKERPKGETPPAGRPRETLSPHLSGEEALRCLQAFAPA